MSVTITDQFCGAGGSSIGAAHAGAELKLALNHWQLAIDTHQANFPKADHDCCDVSAVNPRRYPRTDILLTSPECTHHSYARGRRGSGPNLLDDGDPAAERSRATMWDVPNFAEHHRYELIIVENVVEATKWEPFNAWLGSMHALGYRHKVVCFNSMFAWPTPQSRDRLYVVFWRKGAKAPNLNFGPSAWCPKCEAMVQSGQAWKNGRTAGRYGFQYDYRCTACNTIVTPVAYPAATAIDWALPAQRIGDRDKPLQPATMDRIKRGLEKLGHRAMLAQVGGHTFERPGYARVWPTDEVGPTNTGTSCHALVVPVEGREGKTAGFVTDPLRTQTARAETALVIPLRRNGEAVVASDDAVPTVTAGGNHHGLLQAPRGVVIANYNPGWARDVDQEPTGTITATDHHGLLVPYRRNGNGTSTRDPSPTITTVDPMGLVPVPYADIDDCTFRMLQPHEIAAAMAFPSDYIVKGNKRDQVRQYGNAVTPPAMQMLLERCIPTLTGKDIPETLLEAAHLALGA